jgi:arginyl-tRNA synthetase
MHLFARVRTEISRALSELAREGKLGPNATDALASAAFSVERPKRPEHGDFATNCAMTLTKKLGMPPRAIAEALVSALAGSDLVKSAEIAGPGFVNLRLHTSATHAELAEIRTAGRAFGRAPAATGERVDLEFTSANPTGPLTVASARNAILGDSVARLLEAQGHRVAREYYVNDFGNQVRTFADSVAAVATGKPVPEDGYRGAYIDEIATYVKTHRAPLLECDKNDLARACVSLMLEGLPDSKTLPGLRKTLAALGIWFDVWFSETNLHTSGRVQEALDRLQKDGFLASKDGATFFVAKKKVEDPKTEKKDAEKKEEDKERVVRKSDGAFTYFASDIAYQADKIGRGYDQLIVVLGADHHGYVARVKNAIEALGMDPARFTALLYQLVFILRGGEVVKSSKRAGNVITADEVMDEIDQALGRVGAGKDALRFFFLSRSANSEVHFDLDVATKASMDNPVFYVQYGFARLSSILRKGKELGFVAPATVSASTWSKLAGEEELRIAGRLSDFPGLVTDAADAREPHRVVFYVQDLAQRFQSYFTLGKSDPILPPDSVRAAPDWQKSWDNEKTIARLAWVEAVRAVYGAALDLVGVTALDRMDALERPDAGDTSGARDASGAAT